MHHHPYILHLHHPVRVLIGLVLIITLMILGIRYWVLNTTESQTKELIELNKAHKLLKQDLETVNEQQSALMKELDNTRHAYALLTETNRQLQAELADTHHTILQLNKELLFYQNVTQGNVGTELQARELRVQATPNNPQQYSYRIVLTQGKKVTKPLTGTVVLSLTFKDGSSRTLETTHDIQIRHVQVVEGMLKLADNETPETIHVQLKQKKKIISKRDFSWEVVSAPIS